MDNKSAVQGTRRAYASTLAFRALLILGALQATTRNVRADGGTVRFSDVAGGYRVTLFTSPAPLRAGLVDVSVLVQEADSSKSIPDAKIWIRLTQRGHSNSESITHLASAEAATNKLLQAATFNLPAAGWWEIVATIDGPVGHAEARCEAEVFEPWPHWLTVLPWIAWPIIPIVLFLVHQMLVQRRADAAASQN